jgi:hypothetical protein
MTEQPEQPGARPVPTTAQLVRASIIAVVVAAVLAVVAVLPAEQGIDPTGIGTALGLTAMGAMKQSEHALDHAPAPDVTLPKVALPPVAGAAQPSDAAFTDEVVVTLKPNEGVEVKAVLAEGGELEYAWAVDEGVEVMFDFHGEPKGAAKDVYTSFEKGSAPKSEGSFVAPFEGVHGWYWKNRTTSPVTIRVKAKGDYTKFSRVM